MIFGVGTFSHIWTRSQNEFFLNTTLFSQLLTDPTPLSHQIRRHHTIYSSDSTNMSRKTRSIRLLLSTRRRGYPLYAKRVIKVEKTIYEGFLCIEVVMNTWDEEWEHWEGF
jgi:hypothetical protein